MIAAAQHVSFFPSTLGAWAAVAAAIASGVAALFGIRNRRKIQEVHVLVNSQRADLEKRLNEMTAWRDGLVAEREAKHPDNDPATKTVAADSTPGPISVVVEGYPPTDPEASS